MLKYHMFILLIEYMEHSHFIWTPYGYSGINEIYIIFSTVQARISENL